MNPGSVQSVLTEFGSASICVPERDYYFWNE